VLVLARSNGQSVVLDDRIVVTVIATRTGLVRLGIEAPEGVAVRRGELDHLPEARRAVPGRRPRPVPPAA
jgi:carbon storage regulator